MDKRVKNRKRLSIMFFVLQIIAFSGGRIEIGDANPIAYYLGYNIFAIIGLYMFLSARKLEKTYVPEVFPEEVKNDDLMDDYDDYGF